MKYLIVLATLFFWVSCNKSDNAIDSEVIETRARIVNNLAVDGCEWHFEIANADSSDIKTLVPTLATEPIVKAAVPKYGTEDAYSFIDIDLKYRLTGTQRKITCGFGSTPSVDEVEVLEISRLK
ncbi:hypothetical protein [Persicitalea jodogahamensis]|uniref:Lipoprotein n=1 Tax=Persicitalea jodogahamensis TaxID=402147 RepID=A0A8J3D3Y9_9BACT|nr:hypothetical protein [Persicitalea jodogahamensis]GHB71186.1 hypothetical protein GCM10007390_26200 [Persicitalea jodogahamensis]